MRVAIIGATGQLGTDCVEAFAAAGDDVIPLDHERIDIGDAATVERVLGEIAPGAVVNTAAMHNVEDCEADPVSAFKINGLGAAHLADAATRLGFRLLHISTDYVFDGSRRAPYRESDLPAPVNAYGNTKLSGEHFVLSRTGNAVVVRTSGLYGRAPCRAKRGGLNFVRKMLELARERGTVRVVTDEIVTPTYTHDLARQLVVLARSRLDGIVHATNDGACSWYEFAEEIFRLSGVPARLERATSATFPAPVRRPSYSALENARLRDAGLDRMRHWREALADYLRTLPVVDSAAGPSGVRGR